MTKEQTKSWEDDFEKLTPEPDWKKYEYKELVEWLENNPNLYDGQMYSEPAWTLDKQKVKQFISKTISQEREKWEKEQEPRKCDNCEKQNAIYCSVYCAGY